MIRELSEDEWSDSENEEFISNAKVEEKNSTNHSRTQIRLITKSPVDADNNITYNTNSSLQIKLKVPSAIQPKRRKLEEKIKLPEDMDPEPVCPICLKIIIGDFDEINEHIDECIGPSSSVAASGTCTPTVALPTASTMLSCSLVNVDEDDFGYGRGQYTEADVEMAMKSTIKPSSSKADENQEIQSSLLIQTIMATPPPSPDFLNLQTAIKSLLDRLASAPKCSVCWETLKMPALASINCWHVCCEGCWLRQLGTKRLCPHCSAITNPEDLRKVFF